GSGKDPAPPSRSARVAASNLSPMPVLGRVNHKSSLQGIMLRSSDFRQIRIRQNAVSGFQINGLGVLHGRLVGYSITSLARARSVAGMVRLSAFANLRLITNSKVVGCSTGRVAGSSPLRIRSTKTAARRNIALALVP